MWCTTLIGLVALTASVLSNPGEFERKEINIRVDAEQEPFETVIVKNDGANAPTSQLFGKCLNALNKVEVKLASIEMPGTTDEFVRHVPDAFELRNPAVWEMVNRNPPVSSILDCADAVYSMNKPMFKYNGGSDCKVSDRMYDFQYEPACETAPQEAVFLSTKFAGGCTLPAWTLNVDIASGSCTCVHVTTELMTFDEAFSYCDKKGAVIFTETSTLSYSSIVQLLSDQVAKTVDVQGSNFFTAAENHPSSVLWYWNYKATKLVDSTLYPSYTYIAGDILYMQGSNNLKLAIGSKTFKAGVVCVLEGGSLL